MKSQVLIRGNKNEIIDKVIVINALSNRIMYLIIIFWLVKNKTKQCIEIKFVFFRFYFHSSIKNNLDFLTIVF